MYESLQNAPCPSMLWMPKRGLEWVGSQKKGIEWVQEKVCGGSLNGNEGKPNTSPL